MRDNWNYYECKINNIWNKQIEPVFGKSNAEFFKEKKLTYDLPLSDILLVKDKVSCEVFKELFPLTVGELLKVIKGENESEQHALVSLCVDELSARSQALKELL